MRLFSKFTYIDVVSREQLLQWREPSTRPASLAEWVRNILEGSDLEYEQWRLSYQQQRLSINDFLVNMDGEVVLMNGRILALFYDVKLSTHEPKTYAEKIMRIYNAY